MADAECVWGEYRNWDNLLFSELKLLKHVTTKHAETCFCRLN